MNGESPREEKGAVIKAGDNSNVLRWRCHWASKWGAGDTFVPGMQTRESAAPRWPLTPRSRRLRLAQAAAAAEKAVQRAAGAEKPRGGQSRNLLITPGGPDAGPPEAESLEAAEDKRPRRPQTRRSGGDPDLRAVTYRDVCFPQGRRMNEHLAFPSQRTLQKPS